MSLHFAIRTRPNGASEDERLFRILIVEDDANQREILTKLLQRNIAKQVTLVKIEVEAVATLQAGLALAPTANCTILDRNLPDSDPENTEAHIKDFRPPVIIITGDDDPLVEASCLQKGAERVFVKGQIHGLTKAVIECLLKDLYRLNEVLEPHGYGANPR